MSMKLEHGEYRVWPLVNGQRKTGLGASCDVLRAADAKHAAVLAAEDFMSHFLGKDGHDWRSWTPDEVGCSTAEFEVEDWTGRVSRFTLRLELVRQITAGMWRAAP